MSTIPDGTPLPMNESAGQPASDSSPCPLIRYTLEPLRKGPSSISCADVPGIEWAKLREIRFFWGGPVMEIESRRAEDIYVAVRVRGRTLPSHAPISRADFLVKFAGSRSPRVVSIRSEEELETSRDSDRPVIHDWLQKRGFVIEEVRG